jgi:lycopene cyclase domain-containing protein
VLRLSYLALLAFCFLGSAWLELFLRVNVYRRWRRLVLALLPTVVVFVAWDVAAIEAGHWRYDVRQLTGLAVGVLPLEELLFFLVAPTAAILSFEAVRAVRGWPAGDEPARSAADTDEPASGDRERTP